eukprot:scaffold50321_cov63-Phaeocystis_antarctica.AAC.1
MAACVGVWSDVRGLRALQQGRALAAHSERAAGRAASPLGLAAAHARCHLPRLPTLLSHLQNCHTFP